MTEFTRADPLGQRRRPTDVGEEQRALDLRAEPVGVQILETAAAVRWIPRPASLADQSEHRTDRRTERRRTDLAPRRAWEGPPESAEPSGPSIGHEPRTSVVGEARVVANDAGLAALPGVPGAASNPLEDLRQRLRPAPQDRLARMVDLNEERTAQILRKWARQEAA